MTTRKKTLASLLIIFSIALLFLSYYWFFYPDENLSDFSDLRPSLTIPDPQKNAYFPYEEARKSYQPTTINTMEMMRYLKKETLSNEETVITQADVDNLLNLETETIALLEDTQSYPTFTYPDLMGYPSTQSFFRLPLDNPSLPNLIRLLYIKGLNQLANGSPEQGVETVKVALQLITKIRTSSFSVLEYSLDHFMISEGLTILEHFATLGAVSQTEIDEIRLTTDDQQYQDYINSLKFEFQSQIIPLNHPSAFNSLLGLSIFVPTANEKSYRLLQNSFNLRKNASINLLANYHRELIKRLEDETLCDAAIPLPTIPNCDTTVSKESDGLGCLLEENGLGKAYVGAMLTMPPTKLFCATTTPIN